MKISTIYTKHTATQTKLNINALVGVSNGAVAGQDLAGNTLTNFYSHQLSLCLDNSGVDNENIYYYTQNENTSTTMVEVVQAYIESLSWKDKQNLAYQGSKINPIVLNSQTFEEEKEHFASNEGFSSTKYFVIAEDMPENMMQNITLVNSFIVGDGFSITNTQRGVFAKIDSDSTVSGVAVKANITTNTATYASKNNVSYYGTSALCDINEGYIYSSNVNEVHSEKTYGKNGLDITSTSVFAGGVAGVNFGQISDCYSNIDINSKSNAGAFAGLNLGIISHSYANGSVTSENGKTADAFAKSTIGGVYYSYTVAKVYNTAGSVFGAESGVKIVNCYYDIYATNTSSTTATQLITDKMAVFDSQNILSDEDSNNVNEQTGEVSPKLFLANSQKADDTAPIKFAYNFAYNNGYPTFMGSGYENLTYMSNLSPFLCVEGKDAKSPSV